MQSLFCFTKQMGKKWPNRIFVVRHLFFSLAFLLKCNCKFQANFCVLSKFNYCCFPFQFENDLTRILYYTDNRTMNLVWAISLQSTELIKLLAANCFLSDFFFDLSKQNVVALRFDFLLGGVDFPVQWWWCGCSNVLQKATECY